MLYVSVGRAYGNRVVMDNLRVVIERAFSLMQFRMHQIAISGSFPSACVSTARFRPRIFFRLDVGEVLCFALSYETK